MKEEVRGVEKNVQLNKNNKRKRKKKEQRSHNLITPKSPHISILLNRELNSQHGYSGRHFQIIAHTIGS